MIRRFDRAAQLVAQQLLAVADSQDRDAKVEDRGGRQGRDGFVHRGRAAGEEDAARVPCTETAGIGVERPDFAIDAGFTQTPGDELGHLAAEIEDQDAFWGVGGIRQVIGHHFHRQRLIQRLGPRQFQLCKARQSMRQDAL